MNSSFSPADRQLPTGTVTFLFTDIEGSTALAQDYPEDIDLLLERHNTILRQAIEAHNGHVFRIVGDSFACAFHTCRDALEAALEAQRRLQHEAWHPTTVKVRMGIHTDAAQAGELRELGDGYGSYLTMTRVQRVMSAAHGGQILLSSASAELVRGQPGSEITLQDMGEHRLKGLVNPEHLWQVVVPDLDSDFPPLDSYILVSNNLPAPPAALIGRKTELDEIIKRLSSQEVRLLNLTGPGGIGKTRIALQAAIELLDRFKDGVYFVDLAPIRDPEFVPSAVAQTLDLRETRDRPLLNELKEQLHNQEMLLLLDNFEQVTEAAPRVVELLQACPHLKLLVTSREALHVRGEYVFPIPSLALPGVDLRPPSVEQITRYDAVRLFLERAQAVKPDFHLTNENAPVVAELCRRLDGLPLAIELAAARIRLFSPEALLERMESRLNLLRGGARDLPLRQQTLRSAIDWSFELLDPGEQLLFELLSVFPGGGSFEAVESVTSGLERLDETGLDILDGVTSLVDKSLIRQSVQENGEPRLLMLETIREYAAERLNQDPEFRAEASRRHAAYFADFTQHRWERLSGAGREAAIGELVSDIENIRIAWAYWVEERDLEQLNKFVDSLWLLYDARGWYNAAINLTKDLLSVLSFTPSTPELVQKEIVLQTSLARILLSMQGYTREVEQAYTRALELSRSVGEIPQLLPVLSGLANIYTYLGDHEKGVEIGQKILSLAERHDDASMWVEGHLIFGYNIAFMKDLHLGLEHLEKAITYFDSDLHRSSRFRTGNNPGVACFTTSALFLWMLGFPDQAVRRANESIDLAIKLNHPYSIAYTLFHSSLLHHWRGEAELTEARAKAVLDIAEEHEFQVWRAVAICLHGAALAGMNRTEEGLAKVRRGIHLYQGLKTPPIFWPMLLYIQAGVCARGGKPEEGLVLLEEGMEIASHWSGRALIPEFLRLKGDLLLASNPENTAEAGVMFQNALEVARELDARMMELRIAISMCRMRQAQGEAGQGRRLLSSIYERFTEGFTTGDLKEAQVLLRI